jgi:Flp pilus assembly protein TadD
MVSYYLALASALAKLRQYDRAQTILRRAQEFAPDSAKVSELVGLVAQQREQHLVAGV